MEPNNNQGRTSHMLNKMKPPIYFIFALFMLPFLIAATNAELASVTLAWDASPGSVAGYNVYAREQGESYAYNSPEWQTSDTQCTLNNFDANEIYYFVVRAYDSEGNESGDSNEVQWDPQSGELRQLVTFTFSSVPNVLLS